MIANAYYLLGLYFLGRRSWKEASKYFSKAIKNSKAPPAIWHYRLGFVLGKQKKWKDAEYHLHIAAESAPNNPRRQIRLGMALEQTGKKTEAADIYQRIIDVNAMDAEACFKAGKLFYSLNRWLAAEKAFRFAIDKIPQQAKYYFSLSEALQKQGRTWQVIDALQSAIKYDSTNAQWHYLLGNELQTLGLNENAAKAFSNAINLKANESEWHYKHGLMLEKMGKKNDAQIAYQEAIKYDSFLNSDTFGIGTFHQKYHLWLDAADAYQEQIKLTPFTAELYYRTGYAFDRCFLWDDAIKFYRSALLIDLNQSGWHYRLGFSLERNNQFLEASQSYAKAIDTTTTYKHYWFYRLGFVLWKLDDFENACHNFLNIKQKGYQKFLDYSLQKKTLAKMKEDDSYTSKFKLQGLDNLKDIIAKDPNSENLHYRLSVEYEKMGLIEQAINSQKDAILHSNEHKSDWFYRLGFLLMLLNKFKEASFAFIESRIFKLPDGVNINPYIKDAHRKIVMQYTEARDFLPIQEQTILYESFGGISASCNPYAIFKNLIQNESFSNWTHIWVLDNIEKIPENYKILPNIVICERESDNYIRLLATAKYLINNSTFPPYFSRRKEQKYLNTWHGTPFKTLGKTMNGRFMEHKNGTRNFLQATHLISPNAHTTRVMIEDFCVNKILPGKIAELGYPRVDSVLSTTQTDQKNLKNLLNIYDEKPTLLYAPTWRGIHGSVYIDDEKLINDLQKLNQLSYNIIFRGHPLVQTRILELELPITIVPEYIDTNELLSIVDVLVTDYSSIFFDFIQTKKPILLYCYDEEEYIEERGLYFHPTDMPAIYIKTIEELLEVLTNNSELKEFSNSYIDKFNFSAYDDGNATQRTIDFFFNDDYTNVINREKEVYKKNLLIFGGPFMPNGITTSLLNLLHAIDKSQYNISLLIEPSGIDGFPDRRELFSRIPEDIQVIPRVGLMNMSAEDKWIIDNVHRLNKFNSPELKDRYFSAHHRELQRMIGSSHFDAVINFEGYHKFWTALIASAQIQNKSIYLHNEMYAEWKEKFPYLELVFNSYNNYDNVVSVSETLSKTNQKDLAEFKIESNKFVALPNIIDPKAITEKAQESLDSEISEWIKNENILFITIGRMSLEKDQQKLIRAFAKVKENHQNIQLLILGDGALRGELERLAQELNLDKSTLKFAGNIKNPFPALLRADCFVLPSNHEGQPMTLLEALTLEKQIIATDIVGNRGVLEGRGGLLVENNLDALIQGLSYYLDGNRTNISFSATDYRNSALNNFYNLTQLKKQ